MKPRIRYMMDINFDSLDEKEAFIDRLKRVRLHLSPSGAPTLNNRELMDLMLDLAEKEEVAESVSDMAEQPVSKTFLQNGGM